MYGMKRQQLTVWPGKSISWKKHLKIAYFGGHESELPDFGRTWTPNGWHQVNFWGGPEKFGDITLQTNYVDGRWHQNWAHTSPLHLFSVCTDIREKVIFWVKRSVPKNFQQEIFLGLLPTESLSTQHSENVVGLGDRTLHFSIFLDSFVVLSKACWYRSFWFRALSV